MEFVLLIVQIVLAVVLIALVLMQRSENDGFGMGSGGGSGLLSSRGQSNFMTRSTAIVATLFMANSLLLTMITTSGVTGDGFIDEVVEEQMLRTPIDGKTTTPETPTDDATEENELLEPADDESPLSDNIPDITPPTSDMLDMPELLPSDDIGVDIPDISPNTLTVPTQ